MTLNEELQGTIDRCLFASTDTGFAVFVLAVKTNSIIITGQLASMQSGQEIIAHGTWTYHPKFGKQFQVQSYKIHLPTSLVGLKKYLGSGLIKGIGKTYADKLVNHFKEKTLEIIDKEPHRLQEVPGIGQKRISMIAQAWTEQKEIASIMVFLQDKGISATYAAKIYKRYNASAVAIITENPYRLAEDIWGVGFKTADEIAHKIGIQKNSIARIKAGIRHIITQATNNGHLYVELHDLKQKTLELLELDVQAESILKQALHELHERAAIKLLTQEDKHYITLTHYYYAEQSVAEKIKQLRDRPSIHQFPLQELYKKLCVPDAHGVILNEDQQKAILACLQSKVTIITGGPGTGKTTLIKRLLQALEEHSVSYKLAAPTGRATKRIMEGTGRFASTIHRLLEFDVSTMTFKHNEKNALNTQFLIIDEASMIDIFLANALLKSLSLDTHIVLLGDVDQLPSVGAGNFLNDCIACGSITSIRLQYIFRQSQDSLIIVNAHKINHGEFPTFSLADAKKDCFFIREENPERVQEHLNHIYTKMLPKLGMRSQDAMTLVPMNRGSVGTVSLNAGLQAIVNPPSQEYISRAGTIFGPGDRVMQIRNNYDKAVFNGDIGTVDTINKTDQILTVNFYDRIVNYSFEELDEVVLAYAISIHKSQGSEFPVVIIPLFMQHFMLLQRNLVYTAITRAKKWCIFIGQPKAIAMAIRNNKTIIRTTFLQTFLTNR
jgi:exodeoxyribonuclease V alpha subunit